MNEDNGPCPRALYQALRAGPPDAYWRGQARDFLHAMLTRVAPLPSTLPRDSTALSAWLGDEQASTGQAFQRYLHQRQTGAPRRFFPHRAHAFYFLRHVAPTKLVDGAWLYALLRRWRDPRYAGLVRIYLEELGKGEPQANHVLMFWRLLTRLDCDAGSQLAPRYFTQGAIQLCLAWLGEEFLPEVVGFNLGYEQLPLHLLITVCELRELGIDARYFSEHVTVDNADTGHAFQACEAVRNLFGPQPDAATHRRLCQGVALNSIGPGSLDIVHECDLAQEVEALFRRKQQAGQSVHGNHCRLAGEPVSAWLSDAERMPSLLAHLCRQGWLVHGKALAESRFGRLISGDNAAMAGVFSGYEREILAGWLDAPGTPLPAAPRAPHAQPAHSPPAHSRQDAATPDQLLPALSPACHFTPQGLRATQDFCQRWLSD